MLGVVALLMGAALAPAQTIRASRTVISPITSFNLSYLDLEGAGKGPTLFTLTVSPPKTATLTKYKIRFEVRAVTDAFDETIYIGESGAFTIPAPMTVTSNQFLNQSSSNDTLSIQRPIMVLDDANIEQIILNTGTLGSGAIHFSFQLIDIIRQTPADDDQMAVEIATVRYVRLVAPGIDASVAGQNAPLLYTRFPQFHWSSDLLSVDYSARAVKFVISLFEDPDRLYSLSDLVLQRPLWQKEIYDVNFVQYPLSGAPILQKGRTYFWQVKALLQGPTENEIMSEVYSFQVADLQSGIQLSPLQEEVLKSLEEILGFAFGYLVEDLEGMRPTGTILLNGEAIDLQRLVQLVREIQAGERTVRKAEIE